jgi:hypothetical protein
MVSSLGAALGGRGGRQANGCGESKGRGDVSVILRIPAKSRGTKNLDQIRIPRRAVEA